MSDLDDGYTTVVGSLSLERARAARWKRAAKELRRQAVAYRNDSIEWQKRYHAGRVADAVGRFEEKWIRAEVEP